PQTFTLDGLSIEIECGIKVSSVMSQCTQRKNSLSFVDVWCSVNDQFKQSSSFVLVSIAYTVCRDRQEVITNRSITLERSVGEQQADFSNSIELARGMCLFAKLYQ